MLNFFFIYEYVSFIFRQFPKIMIFQNLLYIRLHHKLKLILYFYRDTLEEK